MIVTQRRASRSSNGVLLGVSLFAVAAYVAFLLYLMQHQTWDMWGAMFIGPALFIATLPALARQARREDDVRVFHLLVAALAVKMLFSVLRYYHGFHLGEGSDGQAYDRVGTEISARFLAGDFDSGLGNLLDSNWIRLYTGLIYTVIRPSAVSGYLIYAWMAFWGTYFYYRAFVLAVPEGNRRSYARWLFFMPSILFWPSSIGKESWMTFGLGIAAFGAAKILRGLFLPGALVSAIGIGLAALVRAPIAGLFGLATVAGGLLATLQQATAPARSDREVRLDGLPRGQRPRAPCCDAKLLRQGGSRNRSRHDRVRIGPAHGHGRVRVHARIARLTHGLRRRDDHRPVPSVHLRGSHPGGSRDLDRGHGPPRVLGRPVPLLLGRRAPGSRDPVRGRCHRLRGRLDPRARLDRQLRDPRASTDAAVPDVPGPDVLPAGSTLRRAGQRARCDAAGGGGVSRRHVVSDVHAATARIGSTTVGVALFVAAAGWAAVAAASAGSSGGPLAALILSAGLTLALCRIVASRWPTLVPAGLVGAAIVLMAADPEATLRSGPLQGPFGYANATAAFLVQATIAALMLVMAGRALVVRVVGAIAAAGFAFVVLITRSWTAAIMLPVVVLISLAVERARGSRAAVAVSGGVFVAILVLTVALGALGPGAGEGSIGRAVVRGTITQVRVALWRDALVLMKEEPVLGVGPGRFASESPTASSDEDLRWAHNEFLQTGAETGLLGFALTVSIFLWGFAALWLGPPGPLAALAAAALALLGIHASVDYVLHFPAVALAGAAVVGTGLGAQRHRPIRTPTTSAVARGSA